MVSPEAILMAHAGSMVPEANGPTSRREASRQSGLHAAYGRNQALDRKSDCHGSPTQLFNGAGVGVFLLKTTKTFLEKQDLRNLLRRVRRGSAENKAELSN